VCTGPEPGFERGDRERIRAACDESRGRRHPRTDLQGCQATLLLSPLFFPTQPYFSGRSFLSLSRRTGIYIYANHFS
jgi:hypothetical protein